MLEFEPKTVSVFFSFQPKQFRKMIQQTFQQYASLREDDCIMKFLNTLSSFTTIDQETYRCELTVRFFKSLRLLYLCVVFSLVLKDLKENKLKKLVNRRDTGLIGGRQEFGCLAGYCPPCNAVSEVWYLLLELLIKMTFTGLHKWFLSRLNLVQNTSDCLIMGGDQHAHLFLF